MGGNAHYDCPCLERCPLHFAMELVGGKWKMQILCVLNACGTLRYNALKKRVGGVSNTVLADTLKELEKDGLVERTVYPEVPIRVEYAITAKGQEVIPILEQLSDWAEKHWMGEQHEAH